MKYSRFFLSTLLLSLLLMLNIFSEEKVSAAYLIAYQIKGSLEDQEEKYIDALIQGIEERSKGIKLTREEQRMRQISKEIRRAFIAQKNLLESEEWLKKINANKEIHTIIPLKLSYFTIKEGKGKQLTTQDGNVIVNYSIKKFNDFFPLITGNRKTLNLSEVIPGLAHGMLSMQEGEIREIYIHPNFAYGSSNNFDPNLALAAQVELLTILPQRAVISPLNEYPTSELNLISQDELEKVLLKNNYVLGWKLWGHLKWGYNLFSKDELISCLKKNNKKAPLIASSELNREINQIHWKIYHQRIKDEYKTTSVYFDQLSQQNDVKCIVPNYLYCKTRQLKEKPEYQPFFEVKLTIKDRDGEILRMERVETIPINYAIKGLKEGLPYLIIGEPATFYIHPAWAYPDVDRPFGDSLLVIDIIREK